MKALSIATNFIDQAQAGSGEKHVITPLKLQKILYYAQGWHLAMHGSALFADPIYAWQYGPVVKTVYKNFRSYGSANLAEFTNLPRANDTFSTDTVQFLETIWSQYGALKAAALVDRTHKSSPWLEAYRAPYSDEISHDALREYFSSLL